MSKICSLDFLGKEEFDLDIISTGGKKLFSRGDKVTPEILLSLYFKDVIAREPMKTPEEIEQKNKKAKKQQQIADQAFYFLDLDKSMEELLDNNLPENLEFDKAHAKEIMQLSQELGEVLGMSDEKIEELKQASYYYKIGRIKLSPSDFSDPDFEKKQADIGYDLLTLEMNLPKQIAEVAKLYSENYNSSAFELKAGNPSDVPYAHIVGIVDYYDRLMKKGSISKEEALKKMLKIGGKKFNVFVLHKFVNTMKNSDD